jgi:hypothetical protein
LVPPGDVKNNLSLKVWVGLPVGKPVGLETVIAGQLPLPCHQRTATSTRRKALAGQSIKVAADSTTFCAAPIVPECPVTVMLNEPPS